MSTVARTRPGCSAAAIAGGAAAPVVAGQREARQLQRVGEVDHVLADSRLLGHARR